MGFAAQGCPQILPAAGPRSWAARGAQTEGSSYGDPLRRRQSEGEFNERGQLGCV